MIQAAGDSYGSLAGFCLLSGICLATAGAVSAQEVPPESIDHSLGVILRADHGLSRRSPDVLQALAFLKLNAEAAVRHIDNTMPLNEIVAGDPERADVVWRLANLLGHLDTLPARRLLGHWYATIQQARFGATKGKAAELLQVSANAMLTSLNGNYEEAAVKSALERLEAMDVFERGAALNYLVAAGFANAEVLKALEAIRAKPQSRLHADRYLLRAIELLKKPLTP